MNKPVTKKKAPSFLHGMTKRLVQVPIRKKSKSQSSVINKTPVKSSLSLDAFLSAKENQASPTEQVLVMETPSNRKSGLRPLMSPSLDLSTPTKKRPRNLMDEFMI